MAKTKNPIPWFSGGLATVVALICIAVMLPNTGKLIVDQSVSPPQTHIEPQPMLVFKIVVFALLPAFCIFVPGRRWIAFEWLGWIMLTFFLVCVFMG